MWDFIVQCNSQGSGVVGGAVETGGAGVVTGFGGLALAG